MEAHDINRSSRCCAQRTTTTRRNLVGEGPSTPWTPNNLLFDRTWLRSALQLIRLAPDRQDVARTEPEAAGAARTQYVAPIGRIGRARVALVTVIEEEFEAARRIFDLKENISGTGYFAAPSAEPGQWNVALMQATDRSNLPVLEDVRELMEDLRPQVIILLGVAGGLCDKDNNGRDGIRPGDVLIADQVSYVEFLKLEQSAGVLVRSYAIDHPSVSLKKLVAMPIQKSFAINDHLGEIAPPEPGPFRIHIGHIVSGEKVLGDVNNEMQQQLLRPYDKALAVDMESIGMARAVCGGRSSFWYHPRYVVIRGISDLVSAADNNGMRAAWKQFASCTAALVAREFVRRLPVDDGAR